jgi:hypothetical protein
MKILRKNKEKLIENNKIHENNDLFYKKLKQIFDKKSFNIVYSTNI